MCSSKIVLNFKVKDQNILLYLKIWKSKIFVYFNDFRPVSKAEIIFWNFDLHILLCMYIMLLRLLQKQRIFFVQTAVFPFGLIRHSQTFSTYITQEFSLSFFKCFCDVLLSTPPLVLKKSFTIFHCFEYFFFFMMQKPHKEREWYAAQSLGRGWILRNVCNSLKILWKWIIIHAVEIYFLRLNLRYRQL